MAFTTDHPDAPPQHDLSTPTNPAIRENSPRTITICLQSERERDPDEDTLDPSRYISRTTSRNTSFSQLRREEMQDYSISQNPTLVSVATNGSAMDLPSHYKQQEPEKSRKSSNGYWQQSKNHLNSAVVRKNTDLVLIVCCFLSGLVDSIAFNGWGCFVSMQSGNTVFVGLGVSGHPPNESARWAKSLISIIAFLIGSLIFNRVSRAWGPLRRCTLTASFLTQASLVSVAAALESAAVVPSSKTGNGANEPIAWIQLLPISLLAFQASGQVVASRLLQFNDIPTVVLTTLYCDLMSDVKLFVVHNGLRNRRVAAAISLFLGAVVGGWMNKTVSVASVLWLYAAVKMAIAAVWLVWKEDGDAEH